MSLVVDASVVVCALTDGDGLGDWARRQLRRPDVVAPHLLPAEVVSVLRRGVRRATISVPSAESALRELDLLSLHLVGFRSVAERAWQLRDDVTAYDGWYVAVAEALDAPLATLDRRLAAARRVRCSFSLP